jgi:malonyl-CoA decarboxylase
MAGKDGRRRLSTVLPPLGARERSPEHSFFDKIVESWRRRRTRADETPPVQALLVLCRALLSERGEVSGTALAGEVLTHYRGLNQQNRIAFFDRLAIDFAPDPSHVSQMADRYREEPSEANLLNLQRATEAPRQELFRRLNVAPEGMLTLVQLRRDVLRDLDGHPEWCTLDADLLRLFRAWFNRGFLELQQIDWRTSAVVLEKLIEHEAVHQIQGWRDLRRRLESDRRCYGFFHQALPDEPLIFIEVALTRGLGAKIQPLLDPDSSVSDVTKADCALFYSITNCQEGLRGVSFGSLLIKQVAQHLKRELPQLKRFATLSPIPGFRQWLTETSASDGAKLSGLVSELEKPDWWRDAAQSSQLRETLLALCAHYLMQASRKRQPLDAVARFHLGNGARLEQLNWLSDTSATGMRRSYGVTANYVYDLAEVERNHEAYSRDFSIAASSQFRRLATRALLHAPDHPRNGGGR